MSFDLVLIIWFVLGLFAGATYNYVEGMPYGHESHCERAFFTLFLVTLPLMALPFLAGYLRDLKSGKMIK